MDLSAGDIRLILDLLSDDDDRIAGTMREKLFRMGEGAVRKVLSAAPPESPGHREASRILRRWRAPSLEDRFLAIPGAASDLVLEEGVYAVSHLGYPDFDAAPTRARLDQMASELAPDIAPAHHPLRAVRTLNEYLFIRQGLRGRRDYERFPDPDNSFIHRVLDRKMGLPIALSVVYILLAQRLDLDIVGVNMPGHFLVRYAGPQPFYIDPFAGGRILTAGECRAMIGRADDPDVLPDASNRAILVRTLANLLRTYAALGEASRAETARRLIGILQEPGVR